MQINASRQDHSEAWHFPVSCYSLLYHGKEEHSHLQLEYLHPMQNLGPGKNFDLKSVLNVK